jgi:uncharacterized protein (DUF1499 family)
MAGVFVRALRMSLLALFAVALGLLAVGQIVGFAAPMPDDLGIRDGRLAACPPSPNCVSSMAEEQAQRVAPLALPGVAAEQRMSVLRDALLDTPGLAVVVEEPGYLHAVARTPWLGFVDDVEILLDDASGLLHVRSASRIGHSDLGANRARVGALRERLAARAGDGTDDALIESG